MALVLIGCKYNCSKYVPTKFIIGLDSDIFILFVEYYHKTLEHKQLLSRTLISLVVNILVMKKASKSLVSFVCTLVKDKHVYMTFTFMQSSDT